MYTNSEALTLWHKLDNWYLGLSQAEQSEFQALPKEDSLILLRQVKATFDAALPVIALRGSTPIVVDHSSEVEYVYVIASSDVPDMYKIGRAKDMRSRLSNMQTATPSVLVVIHVIATAEPELIESILHAAYADKRVRGEWFHLTNDDVERIKQIRGRS